MKITRHILPAIGITTIIASLLIVLYQGIYRYARDKCWQDLSNTATQITKEIAVEFNDDIAKLHIMENTLLDNDLKNKDCLNSLYLDQVLPTTTFSRIDIWYPDNTVVSSNHKYPLYQKVNFDKIANIGEHMSTRTIDPISNNESVYYLIPLQKDDSTLAILIGVIDLKEIANHFKPIIYNGNGYICVIDSRDGSFIIDNWHDSLGNAYDLKGREMARGYEDTDTKKIISNLETDYTVFKSNTTGENLYMYFTPVNLFDWQFAIFAEDQVIFEYLYKLRYYVISISVLVTILIFIYFVWNLNTVRLLKQISYQDALTNIYNRTKYNEVYYSLKNKQLHNIGLIYFDLDGLKLINDTKSHTAGDKYIKHAAKIISHKFKNEVYRVGGDEFIVISQNIDEETFINKITSLKHLMLDNNIKISIGYCFKEETNDIKAMYDFAEKQMYQIKKAHYQ